MATERGATRRASSARVYAARESGASIAATITTSDPMNVKQLFDLQGRVALVTGGSRGLGLQMAEALGEMGARLALTARKKDELDEAVAHLKAQGIEASPWVCDLGKREQIAPTVDSMLAKLGRVEILVNNAGATWGAPAEDHPLEAWDKLVNLNLTGTFILSQLLARKVMIPGKIGRAHV